MKAWFRLVSVGLTMAVAVSACNLGPAPTLTVPLDLTWGPGYSVGIFDSSQLVQSAAQIKYSNATSWPDDSLAAHPERNEIDVYWTGGACAHHPTIRVSGTAQALTVVVANPNDQQIPFIPIACPAVGLLMGMSLSLSQPVEQAAVDFELVR